MYVAPQQEVAPVRPLVETRRTLRGYHNKKSDSNKGASKHAGCYWNNLRSAQRSQEAGKRTEVRYPFTMPVPAANPFGKALSVALLQRPYTICSTEEGGGYKT